MTGDEKWILYNNVQWKILWYKWKEPPPITPKVNLHPKKMILCILWDWKGVLYYELLLENQMINSKYCSQLDQLKAALDKKCPELINRKCIIFHPDNAIPPVSWKVKVWVSLSCSILSNPHTVALQAPLSMEFSRQEYWSCHFLLQGIFSTQGMNLGLLHYRWILYHLSHQGSPYLG